jgi:hypothetical protein
MRKLLIVAMALAAMATAANATSGPGCLRVVNVDYDDVLNVRARPDASSRTVGVLVPREHGIISLRSACVPRSKPWGQRWCPVTVYDGDRIYRGWVKARFVRDSECP